jgi:hypothetical protein
VQDFVTVDQMTLRSCGDEEEGDGRRTSISSKILVNLDLHCAVRSDELSFASSCTSTHHSFADSGRFIDLVGPNLT